MADGVVLVGAVALDAGVDGLAAVDVGIVDGGAGAGVAGGVPRLGRTRAPSPQNRVQRSHCVGHVHTPLQILYAKINKRKEKNRGRAGTKDTYYFQFIRLSIA